MEAYKLDPLHYYTAPGLSWDALLKYTKIDLELLTDMDMYLFIEKGMRGGISMVSKRHAKANNPYTTDYDSKITNNYIMYYDANNLYGWAMSQPLPYSGFKWYDMTDKSKFKKPKDKKGTSRQRSGKGAIRKRFPLQKPRWEKTKLTIRYLYHETYRKPNEQLFSQ